MLRAYKSFLHESIPTCLSSKVFATRKDDLLALLRRQRINMRNPSATTAPRKGPFCCLKEIIVLKGGKIQHTATHAVGSSSNGDRIHEGGEQ